MHLHGFRLKNNLFTKACASKIKLNFAHLELSAEALANANVLFLSDSGTLPYSRVEKKLIDGFLQRGGTVVLVMYDNRTAEREIGLNLLREYSVTIKENSLANSGKAIIPYLHFRNYAVERAPCATQYYLQLDANSCWKPLIVDSIDESHAYAALREVGRGRFICAIDSVALARSHHCRAFNIDFWAGVWDALAKCGLQIDDTKPFDEVPLESGTVRYTTEDHIPIYACKAFAQGADNLKKDYDALLPFIKEELGVAYAPMTNYIFTAKGSGRARTCWWYTRGSQRVLSISTESLARSPIEWLFLNANDMLTCFLAFYYSAGFFEWLWNRSASDFGHALRNYQIVRIFEKAGRGAFAREYREKMMQWNQNRVRYYKIFDELTAKDDLVLRKFTRKLRDHIESEDLYDQLTPDQVAKIFSEAIYWKNAELFHGNPHEADDYVFGVFNANGIAVDIKNVKFEKGRKVVPWVWEVKVDKKAEVKKLAFTNLPAIELVPLPEMRGSVCRAEPCSAPDHIRQVQVSPFWMARRKVTQEQWDALMKGTPYAQAKVDDLAVREVEAFFAQLNVTYRNVVGETYELRPPTEAEWECAANVGNNLNAPWRHDKNCRNFSRTELDAMDGQANRAGIYDMLGKGWELTADRFAVDAEKDVSIAAVCDMVMKNALGLAAECDPVATCEARKAYALCRGNGVLVEQGFGKRLIRVDDPKARGLTIRVVLAKKRK